MYTEAEDHITPLLKELNFSPLSENFLWGRQVNDVSQIVFGEMSRWGNLGIKIFSWDSSGKYIGGQLSHMTVDDQFDVGGVWNLDQENKEIPLKKLWAAFEIVACPWFQLSNSSQKIALAHSESTSKENIDLKRYLASIKRLVIYNENTEDSKIWSNDAVDTFVEFRVTPEFEALGYHVFDNDEENKYAWLKKNGVVYSYIQLVRLNNNLHLGCKSFRWISALSSSGSEEFTASDQGLLTGEMLKDKRYTTFDMPILLRTTGQSFEFNFKNYMEIILGEINQSMEITTEEEFYSNIPDKPQYRLILKHFGLEGRWEGKT